ncbi:hypothetical protein A5819_002259 [Enterococcus sp. 7E2_DIV0204]|uniref:GNAT family N-acetyltransferase n=1 Tax=Candidatus Enterococcus lemimoniae TaxID=1834167 RepID=A0ABZ2T408_9ENTE|nr:bifunctional helix-turn-helix transcriptional regulator/GNAT family N-acetyltransferase [Enterococcus sp. 7E2_DIV0204]OTN89761.1 hypothetical protein A5819_002259 [Enterococcus sp. 7E2_DIV0204]
MDIKEFIGNFRGFNRYYSNLLSKFDKNLYDKLLNLVESRVVTEIFNNVTITAREISDNLNINKSQLSRIIAQLEKKGIIERKSIAGDKRSYTIFLTAEGKKIHQEQVENIRKGLYEELSGYNKKELFLLNLAMNIFRNTYERNHKIMIYEGKTKDLGFISDLHCRIYTEMKYKDSFQKYVFLSIANSIDSIKQSNIWIAEVDGIRVGTIAIVETNKGWWQVRWFAVDSKYQGLGIGKKLVEKVMKYIEKRNISKIFLWTVKDLSAARSLYGKNGFLLKESVTNEEWKDTIVVEEKWVLDRTK